MSGGTGATNFGGGHKTAVQIRSLDEKVQPIGYIACTAAPFGMAVAATCTAGVIAISTICLG